MHQPDRFMLANDASPRGGYASEASYFYMCGRCGQYVDRRSAEQVRHHQRLSHKAMLND